MSREAEIRKLLENRAIKFLTPEETLRLIQGVGEKERVGSFMVFPRLFRRKQLAIRLCGRFESSGHAMGQQIEIDVSGFAQRPKHRPFLDADSKPAPHQLVVDEALVGFQDRPGFQDEASSLLG